MTQPPSSRIRSMFDPQQFQTLGHGLIDTLAHYIDDAMRGKMQVLDWSPPEIGQQSWSAPLPYAPQLDVKDLLATITHEVLAQSLAIHHPHNMGHQVSTPLPIAALCDLVAAITNQAMAVYETGPSATLIERQVIQWLTTLIGWQGADGVLTSGGAQANLTALLAARQHSAGWDVWQQGLSQQPRLCLLASEHAHYSVARTAGIMGLGTDAVIKVATDAQGKMSMPALLEAHQRAINQGLTVMAVVATAGCTPTGSIDPLRQIGEHCQQHALWLHVDGAHGASSLVSEEYRHLVDGIALADSVIWDGHKLLYMPAAVSAVLFRNPQHSYEAFAQDASYLFQGHHHEDEQFNISYRTLECTKRMMGLKLWSAFSLYGVRGLGELVTTAFQHARQLAEMISQRAEFELLMMPETNIVCFRHRPIGVAQTALNQHQIAIRKHVIESGQFHITQVNLHGDIWLRTTLMNPFTDEEAMNKLLDALVTAQ